MRTLIILIYLILLVVYSAIMIVVDKLFKIKPETVYKKLHKVAITLNKIAGNNYILEGSENIPTQPVLIVSNHEGFFDPVSIVAIFESSVALIGKIELKKIPTLSYWITKFGSDFIDRDDMKQSIRVIIGASKTLKNGTSVLIYPEGTRNIHDEEFKAGSFKIAQNAKADILPITVRNTSHIFEQNKFLQLKKSKPVITIHPIIKYSDYQQTDLVTLAANVQQIVNSK